MPETIRAPEFSNSRFTAISSRKQVTLEHTLGAAEQIRQGYAVLAHQAEPFSAISLMK